MGYFKQALQGTGWMSALRALTRGLGFVKIAVLARILTPEDFGLFGIAALTIALLETFTEPGVSIAMIQQEEEIDDFVNTAWTISIIRGVLISLVMFLFSGIIVSFFNQPNAKNIIAVASLIPLVRGFLNPAAVDFVKKLQFNKEFLLRASATSIDIVASIVLALYLKSPIAIIYGMLLGAIAEVIFTLIMPDIKPKFIFIKGQAAKLMGYGKWVNFGRIMSYFNEQFDDILVGKILGTASLGIYQMAFKLSVLPSVELSEVIAKVIFPVYSKIAGDKSRLKKAVYKTTAVISLLAVSIALISFLFPEQIIKIILGNQWLEAAGTLRILAVYGFFRAIMQAPAAMLFASGRPDIQAKIGLVKFVMMAIFLFMFINQYQLIGAALAVVLSSILVQPLLWIRVVKLLKTHSDSE